MYLLCVDCMTAWHNLFGEWISGGNFLPNARGTLDFSAYMAWYTVRRSHCTKSVEASWATEPTINSTLSVVWFVEQFFMTTLLLLVELFFFFIITFHFYFPFRSFTAFIIQFYLVICKKFIVCCLFRNNLFGFMSSSMGTLPYCMELFNFCWCNMSFWCAT